MGRKQLEKAFNVLASNDPQLKKSINFREYLDITKNKFSFDFGTAYPQTLELAVDALFKDFKTNPDTNIEGIKSFLRIFKSCIDQKYLKNGICKSQELELRFYYFNSQGLENKRLTDMQESRSII